MENGGDGLVARSYPTLAAPWTVAPLAPSVHKVFQARKLEWVDLSFSRGSSQTRDQTWVSREGTCTENGPHILLASWLLLIPRFLPPGSYLLI